MARLSELYQIDNFIDTYALGHYARVFDATNKRSNTPVAFKVMRSEHLAGDEIRWEYKAFPNEADLLVSLKDSPHVVDLLDCGYISSDEVTPTEGLIESFGTDARRFDEAHTDFAKRGWRPYITMPNLPRSQNLLYLMKPSSPGVRWRLPSEEGLALALQFAQLMQFAHSRNIVYMDHKLEHVYWDGIRLKVIDFNSSRRVKNTENGAQFRMDIRNLAIGILYSVFTGLSPQMTSPRAQPSSMSEVDARYQDITALDFGVEPSLSIALQELLQAAAEGLYDHIEDFLEELRSVASLHGWDFNDTVTTVESRVARDKLKQGILKIREGQESIREARDLFREAVIQERITEDLESELRRLVVSVNQMLNNRIIP